MIKQKIYQKAIAKRFRNRKMCMCIFLLWLLNVKLLYKNNFFSVQNQHKGKHVILVFGSFNSLIFRFQWLKNFLSIRFEVWKCLFQRAPNDTPNKPFFPGNIQDNFIHYTFDWSNICLFVKRYTHKKLGNFQSKSIYHSIIKSSVCNKNVKRHLIQSNLQGSLDF